MIILQEVSPATDWVELIKIIIPVASLILNIILAIYFFRHKDRKENQETARRIRLDWFKILILDNNLPYFHGYFNNVEESMRNLLKDDSEQTKKEVNNQIIGHTKEFRIRFIDSLLAVDKSIYKNLLRTSDEMVDYFTECMFNKGFNLSHKPMFEDKVLAKITESKTRMLQELFTFEGKSFEPVPERDATSLIKK